MSKKNSLARLCMIVTFIFLWGLFPKDISAVTLKKPSYYLNNITFRSQGRYQVYKKGKWQDKYKKARLEISAEYVFDPSGIIIPAEKDFAVEFKIYNYKGKYLRSFRAVNGGKYYIIKLPIKGNVVVFCKARVLKEGKPVTTWTKPIYALYCNQKTFQVKAKTLSSAQIKTIKAAGVKKYIINWWGSGMKSHTRAVKPGKTLKIKNIKHKWLLDPEVSKTKKSSIICIDIHPVYRKKSDPLAKYKHNKIDMDGGLQREIQYIKE